MKRPTCLFSCLCLLLLASCRPSGSTAESDGAIGCPSDSLFTLQLAQRGAIGDGKTLCTLILQQCIDEVSEQPGGGRVFIGPGQWLTGMLMLRSNVELFLDRDAILLGSTNPYDYDKLNEVAVGKRGDEDVHQGLIVADSAQHIRITGHGLIDAQGLDLALAIDSLHHIGERLDPNYNQRRMRPSTRPKLFFFAQCDDVQVHGITLKNSSGWGLSCHGCRNILIDSLQVINRGYWNNDGIDLNDCQHAVVRGCDINAADDGVCLKSDDPDACCDDILIEGCRICSSASAVKFGTASYGGFRNVTIRDIEVYDTFRSAIAIETVDGGHIDNILVENIHARNTGNPLFIRLGARHDERPGTCRNITIRNIRAEVPFERPDADYDLRGPEVNYFHNPWPSSICGLPGREVENVTLEDIELLYPGRATKGMAYVGLYRVKEVKEAEREYPEFSMFGELPSWAFYVRHVRGITFRNVTVNLKEPDFRPAYVFDDVHGLKLENLNQPSSQIYKTDTVE